jgi:predicted nucleic acid-binding protein
LIYLDTSVLAAYYCPEPLSLEAERIVRSRPSPTISDLTEVELFSALSRKVRTGELNAVEAQRIATEFLAHLEGNLYRRLPIEHRHYLMARDWIGRFKTPLRTMDAIHLAVAASGKLQLVTADQGLAGSGETLGQDVLLVGSKAEKGH